MQFKRGRSSHEQVWQYLRNGQSGTSVHRRAATKAIGDLGIFLRAQRVSADYFAESAPSRQDAERALATSNEIIKRLHGLWK